MQQFVKNVKLLWYSRNYLLYWSPNIRYLVYKSQSLVCDVSHKKAAIMKMQLNISAAPLISYPNGESRNFCNVCSLISVYSSSGYKRQKITIFSL